MKALLFFCLIITTSAGSLQAQGHDFMLLKKGNKTVRRLFTGQYFIAAIDGAGPYPCLIKNVFKDSLRLMSYSLLNTGTGYGGSYIDTVGRFYFTVPYRSITALYANRNKKFNMSGSAVTLVATGGLGVVMTFVNGLDASFAAGSLVISGLGFLLARKAMVNKRLARSISWYM